jgi:hypothetical protein
MTVAELKQKLNEFDDTLEIGGSGHFGEILEIDGLYKSREGFVVLDMESAGEEPD